ncbi:hypothetical protein SprV_1002909200 [Sparganum proliferum]
MEAIYCPPAKRTTPLLSADGRTPLTEKTQILQRLAEQLRGVLKCQMKTNTNLDLPLFLHETIRTVQQLSSGKAPASDASSAEVCKHDCPKFMEHLTALFQETRRQGEVAQDFKDTTIIHLYKRIENHQVCDNHRGICLLNIAGKIFAHILLNRLHNYLDQSVLAKSQCGFRRYRGTMDRNFATHQLQENCQEMRTHLYFPFVDLTNAFDRVNCDEVLNIMR